MNSTLASREATSMFCDLSFSNRLMPDAYRPVVCRYLRSPVVKWLETMLGTWTTESEPSCQPGNMLMTTAGRPRQIHGTLTSEEELFCGAEKSMLRLRVGDGVEA